MSILNKTVSYFPNIIATTQGVEMNLFSILQSNKHKEKILYLRQSDATEQKQLKEKLPCYTVAGTFSRRCDDGLIQLSGLAAVDLDGAEGYDVIHLLIELKKIDCLAYAGLSCRGKRLFCIVPFKYPDKYVKHYERLLKSFMDMGLPMGDDCHKRISQPRFVSWNDEATQFFNNDAKPYHLLPPEKTHYTIKRNHYPSATETPDNPFQWCNDQINKRHLFSEGKRHNYIIHLTRYCNLKGLMENETLTGCLRYVQPDFTEAEIKSIVKHIYATQKDNHNKYPLTKKAKLLTPVFQHLVEVPKMLKAQESSGSNETHQTKEKQEVSTIQASRDVRSNAFQCSGKFNQEIKIGKNAEKWNNEISELQTYFASATLPTEPIKLNQCTTISDVPLFIETHFEIVEANKGNKNFLPYLERLQELKQHLTIK